MVAFPRFAMATSPGAFLDRLLRPVHQWVWGDFDRRVRKLIAFGEVEGDGGRDILRAAEVTRDPLLRRLREITADPNAVAVVIMPELIFSGPERLLHNQRALYIKRLLLFEPRVILTSVPYQLV